MSLKLNDQPILAISLKLYFSYARTLSYLSDLKSLVAETSTTAQLFYIPDFLSLASCASQFPSNSSRISYGAQDGHWEDEGPWTGEVSMKTIHEIGGRVVELGHAERKTYFGETSEVISKKVAAAVRNGLIPLVCIGEENDSGVNGAIDALKSQLADIFSVTSKNDSIILAYEPVWAIGKPSPAPVSHISGVGKALRTIVEAEGRRESVKVVYGGSAGPGIWGEIKGAVDGLFLGRFSHKIENVRLVIEEMRDV